MAYPTTPATFPIHAPLDIVHAADLNAYGNEIQLVEGSWLNGFGQTLAPFRLRGGNLGLEFGDANAAGGGSTLCHFNPSASGFVALHCEPGTASNTLKTRGIPGLVLAANAGSTGFYLAPVPLANADSQSLSLTMLAAANGAVQFPLNPICRLRNTTVQASIPINTMTALTFDTEDADAMGMHTAGASGIVIPAGPASWYLYMAKARFAAQSGGYRGIYLHVNGVAQVGSQIQTTGVSIACGLSIIYFGVGSAGDVFDVRVRHTAAAAIGVGDTLRENQSEFAVMRLQF
jgi:hypothetical protein